MDIRQLRYFQAIAEEGQISKAAKRLHMAQPPLSQQLKLMENEIGTKLVERGPRKIALTDAGRLLQDRASQIFEILDSTITELQDFNTGSRGTLSIGTVASSGTTFLPERIRNFHHLFPEVVFQVREGDTYRILELLQSGAIEIGIVRAIFDPELYNSHDLPGEPMVAATSGPAFHSAADIFMLELAEQPLLLHRSNEAVIVDCCRQNGFAPQILCRGDDVRSLLAWADAGIGFAVVPKSALGLVPSNKLRYRTIKEPTLEIKKAIVWARNRYLSTVAKNFLETMLQG